MPWSACICVGNLVINLPCSRVVRFLKSHFHRRPSSYCLSDVEFHHFKPCSGTLSCGHFEKPCMTGSDFWSSLQHGTFVMCPGVFLPDCFGVISLWWIPCSVRYLCDLICYPDPREMHIYIVSIYHCVYIRQHVVTDWHDFCSLHILCCFFVSDVVH